MVLPLVHRDMLVVQSPLTYSVERVNLFDDFISVLFQSYCVEDHLVSGGDGVEELLQVRAEHQELVGLVVVGYCGV